MNLELAKEILNQLADGVNPLTGEELADEDSCNQMEVVRALHIVLRALDSKTQRSGKSLPENAGKPWTKDDEQMLCRMFYSGCTRKEICTYFKRSSGGIAARLVKLGKISERDEFQRIT